MNSVLTLDSFQVDRKSIVMPVHAGGEAIPDQESSLQQTEDTLAECGRTRLRLHAVGLLR